MSKTKFRMQLAKLKTGVRYCGLSFDVQDQTEGFINPVIREACGDSMDYGKLFAYLFRRFGYPNRGWDGYKELAKYFLTTPHPDLILSVVPYVGDDTSLHFSFLVPLDMYRATEDYGQRFRHAWQARALDWREKCGLPDWMPEWIDFCNITLRKEFKELPHFVTWRETLGWMLTLGQEGMAFYQMTLRANDFREQLYADYAKIEVDPGYCERSTNWREWDAEDPLKQFADPAFAALQDLRRPVRVRDSAINAFEAVESNRHTLSEPAVAGYPSGILGNAAPKEFAALHGLILKLGKGNAARGIKKATALLNSQT